MGGVCSEKQPGDDVNVLVSHCPGAHKKAGAKALAFSALLAQCRAEFTKAELFTGGKIYENAAPGRRFAGNPSLPLGESDL